MKLQFVLAVLVVALLIFAAVSSAGTGATRTAKVLFDRPHDPGQGSIDYIDPVAFGLLSASVR